MNTLNDLIVRTKYKIFPSRAIKRLAEERGEFADAEELEKFIERELRIAEVGDTLPLEIRKQGTDVRRKIAMQYLGLEE